MSDSFNTKCLFVGHHLTVNEVCHQHNIDLKSDQSLSDLKNSEIVFKITALKLKSNFLMVNFLVRQKLAFFMALKPRVHTKLKTSITPRKKNEIIRSF